MRRDRAARKPQRASDVGEPPNLDDFSGDADDSDRHRNRGRAEGVGLAYQQRPCPAQTAT